VLLSVGAEQEDWNRAEALYENTEYRGSLDILVSILHKDGAVLCVMGKNYFMIGDYKKAIQTLSAAATMEPKNGECLNWLGRAYGRQAETGSLLTALSYAKKGTPDVREVRGNRLFQQPSAE
jgi:Flp pilus assembly protein TadD